MDLPVIYSSRPFGFDQARLNGICMKWRTCVITGWLIWADLYPAEPDAAGLLLCQHQKGHDRV
jgi:hypothetical protein